MFTVTTLMASQQVSSFSFNGHFAIANVAWELLTKEVQQSDGEIRTLLQLHSRRRMH